MDGASVLSQYRRIGFSNSTNMAPHVLILGAGLGGLTLAQSLRKRGISFEIFERDESLQSRSGGWAIALHTYVTTSNTVPRRQMHRLRANRVLHELKAALPDDLAPLKSTNHLSPLTLPAELCFYDGSPMRAYVRSSPEQPIIRANRQKLRELLSTGLDIQWDRRISKIEQSGNEVKLIFEDGREACGDVLVGADGAGSFVRSYLVPTQKPSTLPAGVLNGEVTLRGDEFKQQLALAHSAYVAAAENFHLYVGLKDVSEDGEEARYYWYLNFYDPEAAREPFWTATATKQEMYTSALEKIKVLDPAYSRIVRLTSANDIRAPPIVFRDLLLEDDAIPQGRVTLLGDAAHPMAPCKKFSSPAQISVDRSR